MNQVSDSNSTPATDGKADTAMQAAMDAAKPAKGKQTAKKGEAKASATQAASPARQSATSGERTVVTFATAALICPTEGVATKISRLYGLAEVDYHGIREATEEHMVRSMAVLLPNLNEKAQEMHMQRIVDGFVRSAHGAGNFYDTKAADARRATSAIANEDRDEDAFGIDGTANKAERACMFAAEVGLQAFALLAAAHGAVDAYAHVIGKDWKPYDRTQTPPGKTVTRQAITIRATAFNRD